MEYKSIQDELSQLYGDLSKQVSTQPTIEPGTPTPQAPALTPPTGTSTTPNAEPAITPVSTGIVPTTTPTVDVDSVVDSWDSEPTTESTATSVAAPVATPAGTTFDFSELANVLGKDTIKSKEELISAVSEYKTKAEELSSLPENLAKAIEIAKFGGNYLEYLGVSVVDWSKEDPITLYENHVIDRLTDANGHVDEEKVNKLLDNMSDEQKELSGLDLQRQYINYQTQQKALLDNQAKANRANFEQSVRKGLDGLSEIAGFKLSQTHKEDLYSYIVRGEDLKQTDVSQRIFNAFVTKNWGKIDSYRKTQIKNSSLKKILDDVTVPNVSPVGEPIVSEPTRGYSIQDYISELTTQRKF